MRLSRSDWLAHGLSILTEHGPDELKIERLCDRLGVTKGSFYHHFAHRQAFVEALLAYWKEQNTDDLIRTAEQAGDAHERGHRLSDLVRRADQAPEVALRAWARQDPAVGVFLKSVDAKRIDYLTKLLKATYKETSQAKLMAKLIYAHLLGVQQLMGIVTPKEWQQMDEMLHEFVEEKLGGTR